MKSILLAFVLACCAATAHAQPTPATTTNPAYLAANCANCHGSKGQSVGAMPSLAGKPKADIVEQMKLFREGKRPASIMHQLSKGYSEEQVALIADYFSKQKPAN
jgi:cytochrome c553